MLSSISIKKVCRNLRLPLQPSFFVWRLRNCSRRMWLIIAHASDCSAPDNDGSMDLSLLPHGLLLNDSGATSAADRDMIHGVFSWVKVVWDPRRHLSARSYCSAMCLPLSQQTSQFLDSPPPSLTGSQCPIFKNSVNPARENKSIPSCHIVPVRILCFLPCNPPGCPCQTSHLFMGRIGSKTMSQWGCVNMATCMCVCICVCHCRMN